MRKFPENGASTRRRWQHPFVTHCKRVSEDTETRCTKTSSYIFAQHVWHSGVFLEEPLYWRLQAEGIAGVVGDGPLDEIRLNSSRSVKGKSSLQSMNCS